MSAIKVITNILSTILLIIVLKIFQIKTNGIQIPRHHRDDQILNEMLSIERYDSKLRPEAHTTVNVSITLLTLWTSDESSVSYELEFLLHLQWNDFRLKYEDRGKHLYLNALKHSDKLWIPDLYFIKHGKMPHKHTNDIIALKIFNNGDIHFTNRYDMQIICSGDLKVFPFDCLKCKFAIESKFITQERHQLELFWSELQPIVNSESISSTNAYLIHNSTTICNKRQSWRQEYSCLCAVLYFNRDKSYYLNIYFIPTLVLVSLSFLSFWLTTESLGVCRIAVNLSSLLGLIILFVTFVAHLPIASNITAINLWQFVSMLFVCLVNIEFIIQLNRNKKSIETNDSEYRQRLPSKGVPEEVEIREPLCDRQSIEMSTIGGQQKERTSCDHRMIRNSINKRDHSLDEISKYIFPILYYIFVLIYFTIFGVIKNQTNFNDFED